jgi:excisionase family DNA binding protein
MPKPEQDPISIAEAARLLDVEVSYAYALARSGRLEAQKSGGRWLVSSRAVTERLARLGKATLEQQQ